METQLGHRRCKHCHWVEVGPRGGLTCSNPKYVRGGAQEFGSCCLWEREPGSDDELSEGAPASRPMYSWTFQAKQDTAPARQHPR